MGAHTREELREFAPVPVGIGRERRVHLGPLLQREREEPVVEVQRNDGDERAPGQNAADEHRREGISFGREGGVGERAGLHLWSDPGSR